MSREKLALILAVLGTGFIRAESALPAGFLKEVSGPVSLCKYPCAGEFRDLDPNSDAGKILFAGDMIRCQVHGKAVVRTPGNKVEKDICDPSKPVIVQRSSYVPRVPVPGELPSAEVALAFYGTRAGRSKGSDTPVYSPPENGAVVASELAILWRVRPPLPKLTVILRGSDNTELARISGVDGSVGTLDSDVFREALTKYRDASPTHTNVTLVLQEDEENERKISFSVLTREQEAALLKELAQIDPSDGLFRHVERAAVFESFHLYGKVAAEYDSALEEAPKSRDLLEAAYNANARIGNLRHAHDLLQRIDNPSK